MAKRIPSHIVDQIYATADIVEVIGEFVELKKRGSNFFGLSPFSNEKTPSFAVSPTKNIFKDFSTGKGGNAVTFLMEAEGMNFVEALKFLAEKYHIDLELEESEEDIQYRDKRESLLVLNEFAARFFHEQLEVDEGKRVGASYFKERGIIQKTIDDFMLGYAPNQKNALANAALNKQFDEEYLIDTGLCFKSDRDGSLIDRYRGRVIFPIHDHLGKVVGFGGRILDKTKKVAKYINSPESEVYHKSRVLYGLHQGKQTIRDEDLALLVEGYMDVIALAQYGVTNVVATSGTALTDDQIRLLKRFTPNVLLIYDADPAGINAALRGADLMLEQELTVKVLLLPEGHDPDSFVQEVGKSGFTAYREEHAADFVDFKIDHLLKSLDLSDPGQKTQLIHEVASTLARIPDQVKRAVYIDSTARRLEIGHNVMQQAVAKAVSAKTQQEQRAERYQKQREARERDRKRLENQGNLLEKQPQKEQQQPSDEDLYNGAYLEDVPPDEYYEEMAAAGGSPVVASPPMPKMWEQEKEILRLLINYSDRVLALGEDDVALPDFFIGELEDVPFETPILETFKKELFAQYEKTGRIDFHSFLNHETEELAQISRDLLSIPYEVSENWGKFEIRAPKIDEDLELAATNTILHYKRVKVNAMLEDSRKNIRECRDPEKIDELTRRHVALEHLRRRLNETIGTEGGIDPRLIP